MSTDGDKFDRLRSEADLNVSPRREAWAESHLDATTRSLLDEDAKYFLHQSLSTPCLNALRGADGICLEDVQGRRIMEFHGSAPRTKRSR